MLKEMVHLLRSPANAAHQAISATTAPLDSGHVPQSRKLCTFAAMLLLNAFLALFLVAMSSGASADVQAKQWILFRWSEVPIWEEGAWIWQKWPFREPKRVIMNEDSCYRVSERRENNVLVDVMVFTYGKEENPNSYNPATKTGWNWQASVNCATRRAWMSSRYIDYEARKRVESILRALPASLCQTDEAPDNTPNPAFPSPGQQQTPQPSAPQLPEYSLEKILLLPASASVSTKGIISQSLMLQIRSGMLP